MTTRLATDLALLASRREALGLAGLGLGGLLAGCAGRAEASDSACLLTPSEIRGPFPADGTNGGRETISVFGKDGLVRRDIRTSFAGMAGRAEGIPLELELRLVRAGACAPLPAHAVYLWQCDARGAYSLYDLPQRNYLRGLQPSDREGMVRFTAILPGCYGGRCPHLHFEVFTGLEAARHGNDSLLVSQFAFPTAECRRAYGDPRYGESQGNLARWPLERDWMFRGNTPEETAAQTIRLSGDPQRGYRGEAVITLA